MNNYRPNQFYRRAEYFTEVKLVWRQTPIKNLLAHNLLITSRTIQVLLSRGLFDL
jgi:hypothetical protein